MAEIEKKYSDYQETECKEVEQPQVVDEKICPTCEPNPNFKLESDWWEISKAYLNEAFCEYRVRVYEGEALREDPETDDIVSTAKDVAVLKVLREYGKPFNDGIKIELKNASSVVDTYYNTGSQALGKAYLISFPAFNFDQILPESDPNSQSSDDSDEATEYSGSEFILHSQDLFKKLRFIRLTLETYGQYYSLAQHGGSSFVIRQEDDIVSRINYQNTASKMKLFQKHLDDILDQDGFPVIGGMGLLRTKALDRLKFTFKAGVNKYELDKLYAMSIQCPDKYDELHVGPTNFLRNLDNAVIYNFLKNIDAVYNDIVAKETKPWLDWTLDHFYPTYIVDYGNIEELQQDQVGLECLLEEQLGFGKGAVVDSLARDIMSAFTSIEMKYNQEACRELERLADSNKPQGAAETALDRANKQPKILARFQEEFKNKSINQGIQILNDYFEEMNGFRQEIVTRDNYFRHAADRQEGHYTYWNRVARVTYKFTNPKTKTREERVFTAIIETEKRWEEAAVLYSHQKFIDLEQGNFIDKLNVSPHYQEVLEAANQVDKAKGDFVDDVKDAFAGFGDFEPMDLIPIIGLCGVSKLTGKALECIANGVSFDAFLDILIDKTFEYMKLNTLDKFFNDLPYDFREKLNEEIEKQFGSDVDLSDLFGIEMAAGGENKLKDYFRSKDVARRIKELCEKYNSPLEEADELERAYIINSLPPNVADVEEVVNDIVRAIDGVGYNRFSKTYPEDKVLRPKFTVKGQEGGANSMKEFKREKWVLKYIKFVLRGYKVRGSDFIAATRRIKSALGDKVGEAKEYFEKREAKKQQIANLEAMITGQKELFQELLNNQRIVFNDDGTIENLPASRTFTRAEFARITRKIADYRNIQAGIYDELEETSLANLARERSNQIITNMAEELEQLPEEIISVASDTYDQAQEIANETAYGIALTALSFGEDFFGTLESTAEALAPDFVATGEELNKFEKAKLSFEETSLGVKVDAVFDLVFDFLVEAIMEEFSIDELFKFLRSYPAVDFGIDLIEKLVTPACPSTPAIYPPPGDFLKSLSVDICDPTFRLTLPMISIPNINWRYQITSKFTDIFTNAILKLASEIVIKVILKSLTSLEGSLCNVIEALAQNPNIFDGNGFLDALNEAFCNDADNPDTARSKAEELADALFSPVAFDAGVDPTGSGAKVSGIIGSVGTANEVLSAMVARDGEEDNQFNTMIANAINVLAPEMRSMLGSPSQVAYFFSNLGSHLSPDERQRIRDLLDADIPNMPISSAICLTDEELDNWNDLRNKLLQDQGLTPEQAAEIVDDLNNKALEALEDLMDTVANLQSDDGSSIFEDALKDKLSKDPCNSDNPFDVSASDPLSKDIEDELVESFYKNLEDEIKRGMTGRNTVIGEALRDFDGRRNFSRSFLKFFNSNVQNSQEERTNVRLEKNALTGFIMDALTKDEQVISQYPKTVGITQREKILDEESSKKYDLSSDSNNVVYEFVDISDESDLSFTQQVSVTHNNRSKKSFDYEFSLKEKLNDQSFVDELNFEVPISVSDPENKYMESINFQYKNLNSNDLRHNLFNKIVQTQIPLGEKDYSDVYESSFEELNKSIIQLSLTDKKQPDEIPVGYKFGYVNETLTQDSFTYYNPDGSTPYNLEESEKTLGTFGSERIIPLDPSIYGGRYSNPPYYVEPRSFSGWLEIATKAFTTESGCEPKKPPLISFEDIKRKTKDLGQQLREDPRLGRDPDCISNKPFHLLLDKKTKSKLDGVVRTTIRTYLAEFFFKGYGLFSNVELTNSNFDSAFFLYISNKMKKEMYDLGTSFSSKRVSIVREKYWYTFLEQCVEAYQRDIDYGGVEAPDEIKEALNQIEMGRDKFVPIDGSLKKKMKQRLEENDVIQKPTSDFVASNVMDQGPVEMGLQAVAYRLTTDEEEKKNFFNGGTYSGYSGFKMGFASVKKLKFFQKIYFIALYEKQALIVMSEMIRQEVSRLSRLFVDGAKDKPSVTFLDRAILSTFPGSESRIGFADYYLDKQTKSNLNTGTVASISETNQSPPVPATDKPQFILESYAQLVNRQTPDLPSFIRNRAQKYVGKIPLSKLSEFVSTNLDTIEDNHLSDFFGDLRFTYSGNIKQLFDKGFTDQESIERLSTLNVDDMPYQKIYDALSNYLLSREFEDFLVTYDDFFVLPDENPQPSGTAGSTGVKYGLRLSLLLPQNYLTDSEIAQLRSNPDFINKSANEKAFLFQDNSVMVPLVEKDIDVVDTKFIYFNPLSGTETYDLECLVNKLVNSPEYKTIMTKAFNIQQCASMLSVYCMETMMPSFGRKVAPDSEDPAIGNDSENYERSFGKESDPQDDWDGTSNKRAKNFLRREFKSMYLSRTADGANPQDDDDGIAFGIGGLFQFGNPFEALMLPSVRLPWWMRRKLKTKVYDANGQECADPEKDLE